MDQVKANSGLLKNGLLKEKKTAQPMQSSIRVTRHSL